MHTKKSLKLVLDPDAAKLTMQVEDGDKDLLKPNVLKFNAFGLENCKSLRNALDGITYFGSKKYHDDQDSKIPKTVGSPFLNDYVFEVVKNL